MGEGKRVGRRVQHWVREVECTEVEWLGIEWDREGRGRLAVAKGQLTWYQDCILLRLLPNLRSWNT